MIDVDPRIKRTRAALCEALADLLRERGFDGITLNDIAEAAGINRATIYKHYADKFALLDAWIAEDLRGRLFAAFGDCEPTGESKLAAAIAATCECMRWVMSLGRADDRLLRPIALARMTALLGRAIEFAIAEKIVHAVAKPELVAAMASAAICGAAVAWASGPPRALDAHVAKTIAGLATLIVGNPKLPARLSHQLVLD